MAEIYFDTQAGVVVLDFGPSSEGAEQVYSLAMIVNDEALRSALLIRYEEVVEYGAQSLELGFRTSMRLRFWVSFREGAVDGASEFTLRIANRAIEKIFWKFLAK